MEHNSAEYLHLLAEALKWSFADAYAHVADPDVVHVPVEQLLSKERAKTRAALIKPNTYVLFTYIACSQVSLSQNADVLSSF